MVSKVVAPLMDAAQAPPPVVVTPAMIQEKGNALAEAFAAYTAAQQKVDGLSQSLKDARDELARVSAAKQKAQQDLTDLLKG